MALTKKITVDKIEILESGSIQVRQAIRIFEDDKFLSQSYHRYVLQPGDDLLNQDSKVVAIAEATWTPEVVAEYQNLIASNQTS